MRELMNQYHPPLMVRTLLASFTWIFLALFIFLVALLWPAQLHAQDDSLAAPQPSDVRMVIDISGSMKKNDPNNLRRPALDMLVNLLPKGSKAGVWTFGQTVNLLVPHQLVNGQWAKQASRSAGDIRSIAQFTNIADALKEAAYDVGNAANSDYQQHVILLTDGMVDVDRDPTVNLQSRQQILDEIIPLYQKAGFTIHTIALSDNVDKQLLTRLAVATDGKAAIAKTADELMQAFLQVFDQAVPAEELPFDGNKFVTDSSIEEFTALIFRQPNTQPAQLIAPDQAVYDQHSTDTRVLWHHTDKYDLVTVKQPLEGEWQVLADLAPESRITVVSDLSLAIKSMPTNISSGDVIETSLALREENNLVTRREFLRLLTIDVNIQHDGGESWSQVLSDRSVPNSGIYPVVLDYFNKQGEYEVTFRVDGKTFQRQFSHTLSIRQPFTVDVKDHQQNNSSQFTVQVVPQTQDLNTAQTEVVGKLKKPSGTSHIVPFTLGNDGNWVLDVATEEVGDYHLSIRVTATTQSGDVFDYIPEPLLLSSKPDDSVFEDDKKSSKESVKEEPVKEPEPEKEPEKEEPAEDNSENSNEENTEESTEESNMGQILLYGGLGLLNLVIIFVVYMVYRKLFKKKPEVEEDNLLEEPAVAGFTEPPMDEMMVEDLDEPPEPPEPEEPEVEEVEEVLEEIPEETDLDALANEQDFELDQFPDENTSTDAVEDTSAEPEEPEADGINLDEEVEDDALAEMLNDESDSTDEEMPDFSLDDFGPDGLDDLDEEKK